MINSFFFNLAYSKFTFTLLAFLKSIEVYICVCSFGIPPPRTDLFYISTFHKAVAKGAPAAHRVCDRECAFPAGGSWHRIWALKLLFQNRMLLKNSLS